MRTIEISEEAYELYRQLESDEAFAESDLFTLLLLTLIYAKSPDRIAEGWAEVQRSLPALSRWREWRDAVESFASPIRSTDGVMGGAPCIRNTRIPVWVLVSLKKQGMNDGELLRAYPGLEVSDIEAAWSYYTVHSSEVDAQIKAQSDEDEIG